MFLKSLAHRPVSLDLSARAPAIAPIDRNTQRPQWSVMIPAFNRPTYLRRAIQSVLDQGIGSSEMQIEVVDNCSPAEARIEAVVREVGQGRVAYYRQPAPAGMIGNWNACLRRSIGHWVLLLHDDDYVLPGMCAEYARLLALNPHAVMAIGSVNFIGSQDEWLGTGVMTAPDGQLELPTFLPRQAVENICQFSSTVVKRSAYEAVGGFADYVQYTSDWDMWFRIGCLGPVVCTSQPWAVYRLHPGAETARHFVEGTNIRDCLRVIDQNLKRLANLGCSVPDDGWRQRLAQTAEETAQKFEQAENYIGRLNQARWVWRLRRNSPSLAYLADAWIKRWIPWSRSCSLHAHGPRPRHHPAKRLRL